MVWGGGMLPMIALPLVVIAEAVAAPFEEGIQAEASLQLYEARDLFRQALQDAPDAPGVAEHMAWFLFLNGFHDEECRDLLRRAAATGQEPAAMERAARQVERELGLRGPPDVDELEAAKAFSQAMIERAADGTDQDRGTALVDAGDLAAGIPLLEKALAAAPDNASLRLRLARAFLWSGRLAEADAAYQDLLRRYPGNPVILLEAAEVAVARDQLEQAASLVAEASKAVPDDVRIRTIRSVLEQRLAEQALRVPEELPAPPAASQKGDLYQRGEQAEKALRLYAARDFFRQAIREDAESPGLVEHVAWFLFLNGFHDEECRDLLRRAMPKAQEPAAMERAARQIERELGLRGQSTAEEKAEQRAFDQQMIAKATTGTVEQLGTAMVDAGDYAGGIPRLEEALAEAPENGPLELRLARAYFAAGRQQVADNAYSRLNERYSNRPSLLLEWAGVVASRERLEEARCLLIKAEKLRPHDSRILLERSRVEAGLVNRKAALAAVDRMLPADRRKPQAVLAIGRAEHYRGQFGPARDAYAAAIAEAPFLEEAAHGLAESRLRRGELGGGAELLDIWMPRERSLDWTARTDLFGELTEPRLGAQFATYSNSLGYFEADFGLDTSFRPRPELLIQPALVSSIVTQSGFTTIDRFGGFVDVVSRENDAFETSARIGGNAYTNDWATPIGGITVEAFPVHWLDIGGGADYFNLIDFQPPFGVGIYDIVTTIGAVGEKISSTQGNVFVRLRPWTGWTIYARSRVASFSDGNVFHDDIADVSYELRPGPLRTRVGWTYYFLTLRDEAPLFQQTPGGPATPAYYSPDAFDVGTWNLELSDRPRDGLELGGEGHLFHILKNNGLGVGIFLYATCELGSPYRLLRLDARYFTQDRGLTRQSLSAGSYDALNFVLSYDSRF